MKPSDLLTIVLGIGSCVLGALVPTTTAIAIPAGLYLIGQAIPQTSELLRKLGNKEK
jgi:hypothetical protein